MSPVLFVLVALAVMALAMGSSDESAHGRRARKVASSNAQAVRQEALLRLLDMTEGTTDLSLRAMRYQWEEELLLIQDGD